MLLDKIACRLRSWCIGKSLSYWDNAIDDAETAEKLIRYIRNGYNISNDGKLFELAKGNKEDVVIYAYTLYYINGYLDYLAAKIFGKLGGISQSLDSQYFKDTNWVNLIDWAMPLVNDIKRVNKYTSRHDLSFSLTHTQVLKNLKRVQNININRNRKRARVTKDHISKLFGRFDLDPLKYDSNLIVISYKDTQNRAIYWDKLYIRLIDMRLK